MHSRKPYLSLFLIMLVLVGQPSLAATLDVIALKSGKKIKGVILEETGKMVRIFTPQNKKLRVQKSKIKYIRRRNVLLGMDSPEGFMWIGRSTSKIRTNKWNVLQDTGVTVWSLTYAATIITSAVAIPSDKASESTLKAAIPVIGPLLVRGDTDKAGLKDFLIASSAVQALSLTAWLFGVYKSSTLAFNVGPAGSQSVYAWLTLSW